MSEEVNKKRGRSDSPPLDEKKPARRSRFEPAAGNGGGNERNETPGGGGGAGVVSAAAVAAAKAMEITRALQARLGGGSVPSTAPVVLPVMTDEQREKAMKEARAREIQAQIAAQMASVSSMLANAQKDKKPEYRPLLLDKSGREVDASGKVVTTNIEVVKTLAANAAAIKAKRENPYLAHRKPELVEVADTEAAEEGAKKAVAPSYVDPRLISGSSRDHRAKNTFNFVEEGTYVKEAEKIRHREERKIIAGYSSGRKRPDQEGETSDQRNTKGEGEDGGDVSGDDDEMLSIYGRGGGVKGGEDKENADDKQKISVPPPADGGVVPVMEWWDEAFLPKKTRDLRRRSKAAQQQDDSSLLNHQHCRTFKYIQHPVPIQPLGGELASEPLKMYLTKKERKRIRRTARHEREMEKRDKIMMGLIPAPEPKFKLSNFMKILGDQAVADPSKVERRVVQQMQQRIMNHEMRNEARKLTPAERKEKKKKKLQEDTSRQVDVALFRVKDFSDPKHRFKVDVNMHQLNLGGLVLLCPAAKTNLVVAEGGPKGIKKLIHLMTSRVAWTKSSEDITKRGGTGGASNAMNGNGGRLDVYSRPISYPGGEQELAEEQEETVGMEEEAIEVNDEEEEDEELEELHLNTDKSDNRCDLLWQGVLPKKTFQALRFQECKSAAGARKVLESKGVAHYWDMVMRADEILESQNILY